MNRENIRDYILLSVGVTSIIIGGYVAIQNPQLIQEIPIASKAFDSVETVTIGVGGLILTGMVILMLFGVYEKPDQPLITSEEPEISYTKDIRTHSETEFNSAYETALKWFDKEKNTRGKAMFFKNRVGVYGYEIREHEGMPVEVETLFEQVQDVIAELYAAENGCDVANAQKVVRNGEWSDSIPAQFIAESGFESGSLSVFDRLNAWLSPKETFRDRIDEVLDEAVSELSKDAVGDVEQ